MENEVQRRRHAGLKEKIFWLGLLALSLIAQAVGAENFPLPGANAMPPSLADQLKVAVKDQGPGYQPRTVHLATDGSAKYTNRLILESSPYLLQHAHNPVNWYAWGDEAFETARKLNRPVLLSVGYSTCHWCHVMEELSFENEEVAEFLNRHYIAIKVDREERPDIDALYMAALYSFKKSGGWPMTVWLTPDRKPFYAGTYYPPYDSGRRPGFLSILKSMHELYSSNPTDVEETSRKVVASLERSLVMGGAGELPTKSVLDKATLLYQRQYDNANGGMKGGRKFPSSLPNRFLLREARRVKSQQALHMVRQTLDAMQRGGIYDHIGGGFHRYTTDATWTVPHFEKMLYDNALLVRAYVEAYQVTGNRAYADTAADVLTYVMREMTSPEGPFYSATDADSEGEEGIFFVWRPDQVRAAVGADFSALALSAYGVTEAGNFEQGATVLRRDRSVAELAARLKQTPLAVERDLASVRKKMSTARAMRPPPLRDEKQIVAWNGLMISAFVRAGQVLSEKAFVDAGARAADTLLAKGKVNGKLVRYLREGKPKGQGVLEDYAFLEAGLIDLFEATSGEKWLVAAMALQVSLDRDFWDPEEGGYFVTRADQTDLLVREKALSDGAVPCGNSIAAMNLLRLYSLTTDDAYRKRVESLMKAFSTRITRAPTTVSEMLLALDFYFEPTKEILIVAPENRAQASGFVKELHRTFLPNRILLTVSQAEAEQLTKRIPLLEGKRALGGKVTAYVCENQTCERPVTSLADFQAQLQGQSAGGAPTQAPWLPQNQ